MTLKVHRGSLLHFPKVTSSPSENYQYWNDGVLVVEKGRITHVGDAKEFFSISANKALLIQGHVAQHHGLLIPGMIDAHVHFPQIEMIASYGKQLLDWLNNPE